MKLIKKITAAVTAMAMAASMMSIGASAMVKGWTLHYNTSYPSNANRFLDKIEFFYAGSPKYLYNDYLYYFNHTENPNGSVPCVEFYGYVINQDGSGYDGIDFLNLNYYPNNTTDNNSSIGRLHLSCPLTLSHPVIASKKLVVFHLLHDVTYNTQINGKGVL